ncbi:MarR family transcriptional regulator [Rathayibacter sp. KR2-224]|uniref:MarR family transcriptional regulator n=1 Tax=Rathayibacter sp. KR2-224 TaxID=3400913 RepID=UPI003C032AD0
MTLPQFRVLVVLRAAGRLRMGVLEERMNFNPPTFSRFVDRTGQGGWLERRSHPTVAGRSSSIPPLVVRNWSTRSLIDGSRSSRRSSAK